MARAIALMAIVLAVAGAQAVPLQQSPVVLAGSCDGRALALEARAAAGTRVIIGVAATLTPDGQALSVDDPLFIASSSQPQLRGVTGENGVFRVRIPLDAAILERLPPVLFAQAARLLPNDAGVADASDVVSIAVPSARTSKTALLWGLTALATLLVLFFLPARIGAPLARTAAAGTLVALPFLLLRGHGASLMRTPYLPFEGHPDAALERKLGHETVNELRALNAALPESQPVIVLLPLEAGTDLPLRRLFAKRPYATVPRLDLVDVFAKGAASSAVVVTFDHLLPDDAEDVFEATSFRAWRRRP